MSYYYQNVLFAEEKAYLLFKDAIANLSKNHPELKSYYERYKEYRTPEKDYVLVWDWDNHMRMAKEHGEFGKVFDKIRDIEDMTGYAYKLFEIDEENHVIVYDDDPYDAFAEINICTSFENNLKQFILPQTLKNAKKWYVKLSYSWTDGEDYVECLTEEEAFKMAKSLIIDEAECYNIEHHEGVSISFDECQITLIYPDYKEMYAEVIHYKKMQNNK